jgi:hypothetical protein
MDFDEELNRVADSYRPDRQPSLDELVTRARGRRRTALVASAAVSVVVVAAAVAVASAAPGASHTIRPVGPTTTTPGGCDVKPFSGILDYVDFVRVGGQSMDNLTATVERAADLGSVVMTVTCQLDDRHEEVTRRDGTASFLPVGTPVHAVNGFDPRCRVAAEVDGHVHVYLAQDPNAPVATPVACAQLPGLDPDGPSTAPGDVRSAPTAYRTRTPLPDCGSFERSRLGKELDAGARAVRDCFVAAQAAGRPAELRMVLATIDAGPAYEVFRTQRGGIEQWTTGYNSTSGPHGTTYWLHFTCHKLDSELTPHNCASAPQ